MTALTDLKAALAKLPPRPWNTTIVPPSQFQQQGFTIRPGDDDIGPQGGFEVGTLRAATGANVVEPWPESASMVIGLPGVLAGLTNAINAATILVAELEQQAQEAKAAQEAEAVEQAAEASKPSKVARPPA